MSEKNKLSHVQRLESEQILNQIKRDPVLNNSDITDEERNHRLDRIELYDKLKELEPTLQVLNGAMFERKDLNPKQAEALDDDKKLRAEIDELNDTLGDKYGQSLPRGHGIF